MIADLENPSLTRGNSGRFVGGSASSGSGQAWLRYIPWCTEKETKLHGNTEIIQVWDRTTERAAEKANQWGIKACHVRVLENTAGSLTAAANLKPMSFKQNYVFFFLNFLFGVMFVHFGISVLSLAQVGSS